jgi:hypothetical protein
LRVGDASQVVAVTYAERWSKRKGEVVRPLAEEDARERHERGELYTVLVGDPGRPRAYLEVRLEAGFVGVHFLDDELRNHLTYLFTRPPEEQGDLFLEQISRRVYDDAGDLTHDEHYVFDPPDRAHVKKRDHVAQAAETYDLETDLSENHEPPPEFGRYESIARVER